MLADIADLNRRVVGDFMLNGKVPLLSNGRLNGTGPSQHGRSLKEATRGGRCEGIGGTETWTDCDVARLGLRWCERRVLGKTEIGSSALKI